MCILYRIADPVRTCVMLISLQTNRPLVPETPHASGDIVFIDHLIKLVKLFSFPLSSLLVCSFRSVPILHVAFCAAERSRRPFPKQTAKTLWNLYIERESTKQSLGSTAYRLPRLPSTVYRLPPTAYCLPPTAHCLPPSAVLPLLGWVGTEREGRPMLSFSI